MVTGRNANATVLELGLLIDSYGRVLFTFKKVTHRDNKMHIHMESVEGGWSKCANFLSTTRKRTNNA